MNISFLHIHPQMEKDLGLDRDHVIVDRKDLEKTMVFLIRNPTILRFLLGMEEFEKQWGAPLQDPTIVAIKEESYPPGYPKPNPERPEFPPDRVSEGQGWSDIPLWLRLVIWGLIASISFLIGFYS